MPQKFLCVLCGVFALTAASCTQSAQNSSERQLSQTQAQLATLLEDSALSDQTRYAVINRLANNLYNADDKNGMALFLSNWVETHPDDSYNAYWLLLVAQAYLEADAKPVAEYYFERILRNYPDLLVQGKSVHFLSLQHLIHISTNATNRISYFNALITRFPANVSTTELYVRLAKEYEKEGEWAQALKSYALFLEQPDASTIQILDLPNAYDNARQMVQFSQSSKNWTFESLDALETAVKNAITNYDWRALDRYRSKVNFFAMSWKASESAENALESFSMHDFMRGNRIRYNATLDDTSNPNEAYLRTTGWSLYINVWYLYFRKINFPVDPEIHGRWEWAGIYYGEKL